MKKTIDTKTIIAVLALNFVALKMMFLPSICSAELNKNGFTSVLFMMALEVGVVAIFIYLSHKTDQTFCEFLEVKFGKVIAKVITAIYLIYFLINTFAIVQSFYLFLTENLYSKLVWIEYILPIFIMLFFVCVSSFESLTRLIQCFFPFIVLCVFLSLLLGAINCDYSNILPLFEGGYKNGIKIFDFSYWFGDAVIMVLFFGKIDKKKSYKPILISTTVMSVVISFFFLVFYCIYESNALNNKEAIVDILKILPQNSDIGNVTWLVTIIWQVIILIYICLQCFATKIFFENLFCISNSNISVPIILALILGGLFIVNFDMSKVLTLLVQYAKYLALFVQYLLPVIFLLFSFKKSKSKTFDQKLLKKSLAKERK